jgi:hypothetical protein
VAGEGGRVPCRVKGRLSEAADLRDHAGEVVGSDAELALGEKGTPASGVERVAGEGVAQPVERPIRDGGGAAGEGAAERFDEQGPSKGRARARWERSS